ncbi:MAG TPA: peroxidase family protein, partial [Lacipirellulaceae bacterium]|nr:peroxidase family protein [Lacipirellulaceae bacterium]
TNNPGLVDQLLRGAATQLSEEVDLKMVDSLRTILFGPPGAGGTDLAAVDIQRGRDHGLPDYNTLRESYGLAKVTQWSQITSNPTVQQALSAMYNGNINNVDPFVGGLAEDHVSGSSLGPLFHTIIAGQFQRSRDGDRLFYRSNAAGLYQNGVLKPSIASLVNLNTVTLADVIQANTGITGLPSNVFFVTVPGDFNHDGVVDTADLMVWKSSYAAGTMTGADLLTWQSNLGAAAPWAAAASAAAAAVPEPTAAALALGLLALVRRRR